MELDNQISDPEVSLFFKMSQNSSTEEDLGLTNTVKAGVQLESLDHFLASLLAVHESLGNDVGCQQFVSLPELLEGDPVGESLSADSDALEDTVTPQLVQDQGGVDFSRPLLVVGDDAPDKVGVGVAQGHHQLAQLVLVVLAYRPEHALASAGPELQQMQGVLVKGRTGFIFIPFCFEKYN